MAATGVEQGRLVLPIQESLKAVAGMVRLEDLAWPEFDPERPLTMVQYVGEVGLRLSEKPRETATTDTALGLFGRDFEHAKPDSLKAGLYFPKPDNTASDEEKLPKKAVIKVTSKWYHGLDKKDHSGIVPFNTGVAASEDLYEDIVANAPYMANKIFNRTLRKNTPQIGSEEHEDANIEENENLAGESVIYAMSQKHERLEQWDEYLGEIHSDLKGVSRNLESGEPKRIKNLETYREGMEEGIHVMVQAACRGYRYGTHDTRSTHNGVTSNIYRGDSARWLPVYVKMALNYNDALRGKINQSVYAVFRELSRYRGYVINNIDREYED